MSLCQITIREHLSTIILNFTQIFHSITYIKIFIMLHFILLFGHNYAIIMPKKGVKHYATYYAY